MIIEMHVAGEERSANNINITNTITITINKQNHIEAAISHAAFLVISLQSLRSLSGIAMVLDSSRSE